MPLSTSPRFLRTVLLLDAASVLLSGVPQVLATAWLARWTGLEPTLLLASGLFLFVYTAFVGWIGTRQPIPAASASATSVTGAESVKTRKPCGAASAMRSASFLRRKRNTLW